MKVVCMMLVLAFLGSAQEDCDVLKFRLRHVKKAKRCLANANGQSKLQICKAAADSQGWELKEQTDGGYQIVQGANCLKANGKVGQCTAGDTFNFEVKASVPWTKVTNKKTQKCLGSPKLNGVAVNCASTMNNKAQLWW
eukprot:CAMPEP_0175102352 /NCGR_PEP_ID=MMETSP0086_2-20121207/8385_1 /TAXON_ID=136419 /ORGANISM="Unknown Unknown, Strain D1" /LENGTH=138 /DNA_ID=CAMNT_0016377145 /DNA_START=34 /DNA_END=447 /DNA_ORIENTATION=-